jgi:hypothetical protein
MQKNINSLNDWKSKMIDHRRHILGWVGLIREEFECRNKD